MHLAVDREFKNLIILRIPTPPNRGHDGDPFGEPRDVGCGAVLENFTFFAPPKNQGRIGASSFLRQIQLKAIVFLNSRVRTCFPRLRTTFSRPIRAEVRFCKVMPESRPSQTAQEPQSASTRTPDLRVVQRIRDVGTGGADCRDKSTQEAKSASQRDRNDYQGGRDVQ